VCGREERPPHCSQFLRKEREFLANRTAHKARGIPSTAHSPGVLLLVETQLHCYTASPPDCVGSFSSSPDPSSSHFFACHELTMIMIDNAFSPQA